jgi:DNA-binding transcriptional regulator YhcF (GntR family)
MRTMTVDVDIDPWEVLTQIDEEEIVDHLRGCGYFVEKESKTMAALDSEDLNFLLSIVKDNTIEGRRIYDKLKTLRFG